MPTPKYNRDGGVWRVRWSETTEGFRGHVIGHHKVRFQAPTWDELHDAATDAIDTHLQAGEYAIDWNPTPNLRGQGWYVHPDFVSLYGNDGVYLPTNDYAEIFSKGQCDHCSSLVYPRTETTMRVEIEWTASICQGRYLWSKRGAPNHTPIFAEKLVDALRDHLTPGTDWRPTIREGRGRIQFLEPAPENPVETVGVTTRDAEGWLCPQCGAHCFGQNDFDYSVGECIPEDSVPDADAFWLKTSLGKLKLCVSSPLWEQLNTDKVVQGVTSGTVPLVKKQYIDPDIDSRLRER